MNRLFVYGIFLGQGMRDTYGMTEPRYATVADYVTVGSTIVKAVPVDNRCGCALTGLLVNVPYNQWEGLDALEGNYDRKIITTTSGEVAYMYVARGVTDDGQRESSN